MKALLLAALFIAGCAHAEPYEVPPNVDAGAADGDASDQADAGDPCADCWAWCGKEDNHRDVIFCTNYCARVCS